MVAGLYSIYCRLLDGSIMPSMGAGMMCMMCDAEDMMDDQHLMPIISVFLFRISICSDA